MRRICLLFVSLVFLGGCATSGTFAPRAYPGQEPATPGAAQPESIPPGSTGPTSPPEVSPRPPSIDGAAIAAAALRERGRPYRLGGETPGGFDCSGLVQYVFAEQGLAVPRQVIDQFTVGEPVPREEIEAGDLLFFATTSDRASHVAIALDGDRFIHAPNSRGRVRIDRLSAPYWSRRFLGARRIDGTG